MATYLNNWASTLPQFPSAGILATDGTGLITSPQMLAMPTTTSTVGMVTINNVRALHFYGTANTFLGSGSGNFTLTGIENFSAGTYSSSGLTSGASNCASGAYSLLNCTTSPGNCAFGRASLQALTTGIGYNTAIGYDSLYQLNTGSYNLALGYLSGDLYTGAESSNILLRHSGVIGESNIMRLGTTGAGNGQVNKTFIAGVTGITPGTAGALVNVTDSSGQVGTISNGTAGWVLTSNGVAANPSFQAPAAGGITTLTGGPGSVGSATGSNVTLTGGTSGAVFTGSGSTMTESFNFLALPTTTSTNGQILINSTAAFHQYGTGNHFSGSSAGNFTLTATYNTGIGQLALHALTSGTQNSAVGQNAGAAISSGRYNMCFGTGAGSSITTTDSNVLIGQASGTSLTGGQNTAVGGTTLYNLLGGSYNSVLGQSAGSSLTGTESSNIYLNNTGTVGESNTLRIGAATGTGNQQLNKAVVCGIYNKAVGATAGMVLIDSTDVMGSVPYVPSTAWTPVLNFGGGTTGITYTTQTGTYCRTGGVVTFTCNIVLSNKGSSTGAATITGLPVAAGATTVCALSCSLFTGTADHDPEIELTSSTINWFEVTQTGSAKIAVTDTAFANTTSFTISGSYLV